MPPHKDSVTVTELLKLLEVYNNPPGWLPQPNGAPLAQSIEQGRYQEAYSLGVQVFTSKEDVYRLLSSCQGQLEGVHLEEVYKWSPNDKPKHWHTKGGDVIDLCQLDLYSQRVLEVLRSRGC